MIIRIIGCILSDCQRYVMYLGSLNYINFDYYPGAASMLDKINLMKINEKFDFRSPKWSANIYEKEWA